MANTGQPDTGGSQFFINLVDNIYLDFDEPLYSVAHPVFGKVITGWDVVQLIGNVPVDGNDKPITPVVMNMVRVTQPLTINDVDTNETSCTLYPNPVKNQLHIDMPNGLAIKSASVYDLLGKRHILKIGEDNTLNMSPMPSGIYLLKLETSEGSLTKKFIKE